MDTEQREKIIEECREMMSKAKYDDSKTDQFCATIADILDDIIGDLGDKRKITYSLKKHIDRVEFRINISGDKIDPMTEGKGADGRRRQNAMNSVFFNPETSVSITYSTGWNHISVKSPSRIANSKLLSEPMIKAMLLGAALGLVLRFMPDEVSSIVIDDIASPLMVTVGSVLMGLMGPVFFLFTIVSVTSLGSTEELAGIGKVMISKFVILTFIIAVITTAIGLVFFPVFGTGNTNVDLGNLVALILSILPNDLITPFVKGDMPQIILIALVLGTALLMMGDSAKTMRNALSKLKDWAMEIMMIMMKVIPLLPFISTMKLVATGHASAFISGWKYIAATYICYLLFLVIEFIIVSVRCRTGIRKLGKMLRKVVTITFVTAAAQASMQQCYEVSEQDMGIDKSFSDMWIPLSSNLFAPSATISLVLSVLFVAEMTNRTADPVLILVMIIMAVQLSLASTGTTAGVTIMLETLAMSTELVGLFSAFEIFTRNAAAAFEVTVSMLEQYDAARVAGKINT